jgi:hypothetical protein
VALLEEQQRPLPAGVGDPVDIRRTRHQPAAENLDEVLVLDVVQHRRDGRVLQAEPAAQLGARELAREVKALQHELLEQVEGEPGLLDRVRCHREGHDGTGVSKGRGQHQRDSG